VSPTTASYVLNGRDDMRISKEAHRRVQDAAARLRYRQNRTALNLRTKTTKSVGLLCDFLAGGRVAGQLLSGASVAARAIDHLLVVGEVAGGPGVEDALIEEMADRQVDGIVYAAAAATSAVRVSRALAGQRAVLLNCVAQDRSLPAVVPDDHDGGRLAAQVLLDAGHRTEMYVVGSADTPVAGPARLAGLTERLDRAGVEVAGVVACDWAVLSAFEAVRGWLAVGARPRALVCLDGRVALGTWQAVEDAGLRVPADISIVAIDADEPAQWVRPTLTSVDVPYVELGRRAVQLLMGSEEPPARVFSAPMRVRQGASVNAER
jgi:LacI family transcriptional regulator